MGDLWGQLWGIGLRLGLCQICLDWDLMDPEVKGPFLEAHCMPGDLELPMAEIRPKSAPRLGVHSYKQIAAQCDRAPVVTQG